MVLGDWLSFLRISGWKRRVSRRRRVGRTLPALVERLEDRTLLSGLTATADTATVTVDGGSISIDVLLNDFDGGGEALDIVSVNQPAEGSVQIVDAAQSTNGQRDELLFSATTGYAGTLTFSYTVQNVSGETATANVTVTVDPEGSGSGSGSSSGSGSGGGSASGGGSGSGSGSTSGSGSGSGGTSGSGSGSGSSGSGSASGSGSGSGSGGTSGSGSGSGSSSGSGGASGSGSGSSSGSGSGSGGSSASGSGSGSSSGSGSTSGSGSGSSSGSGSGSSSGSGSTSGSGSGSGTVETYDYATFAEGPIDHGLTLPTVGEAVTYTDPSAFVDGLLGNFSGGTTAIIDDTITDGDSVTTTTTDSGGAVTVVTDEWSTTLTKLGNGTGYTETLLATYTITTTWNNGEGESYTLTQWGTHEYILYVGYAASGAVLSRTLTESKRDYYAHLRGIDTSETDDEGDLITSLGTVSSSGVQGYDISAGTTFTEAGGITATSEGVWLSVYSHEEYESDVTTTVMTPAGSTVAVQSLTDGIAGWSRYDERLVVTIEALNAGGGTVDLTTLWIDGQAPQPYVGAEQTQAWANWMLEDPPGSTFDSTGITSIDIPADFHHTRFHSYGDDHLEVITTTDIDESETETLTETITDEDGNQSTLTTDITTDTFAEGTSTLIADDGFSFSLFLDDEHGTASYGYADAGTFSETIDELTIITITSQNSLGSSTLTVTDDIFDDRDSTYTTTGSGDMDEGQSRYDESGGGLYSILLQTTLVSSDTSAPGVTIDLDTLDRVELDGSDTYDTFTETTQVLTTDPVTGIVTTTDTYTSEYSSLGSDTDSSLVESQMTVVDTSDPDATITLTTFNRATDAGHADWDSLTTAEGTIISVEDAALTAGSLLMSLEDDTTYADNASGHRTSTLISNSTVDLDHDDNGIIKTLDSHDSFSLTTNYDWTSHADGFSDLSTTEALVDADEDGTVTEAEIQTDFALTSHDFSEYHEIDGLTSTLVDIGSTETADGVTPEGLDQYLLSTMSFIEEGDIAFTLDTTSTIDLVASDTDVEGGTGGGSSGDAEDPDEVVTLTMVNTLASTSVGHTDFTASEFVDFDEIDLSQPGIINQTTVDRTYNATGYTDTNDTLSVIDELLADETTRTVTVSSSLSTGHSDYSSSDETTWDLFDETAGVTTVTSVGHSRSTVTGGIADSFSDISSHLTTIGTLVDSGETDENGDAVMEYEYTTTGNTDYTITSSDTHDFTTDDYNRDETATRVYDGPTPLSSSFNFASVERSEYTYTSDGNVLSTYDAAADLVILVDGLHGWADSTTLDQTTSQYHLESTTYSSVGSTTPDSSSSQLSDVTYIEDGITLDSLTLEIDADFNSDGSSTTDTTSTTLSQTNSTNTTTGQQRQMPGFTTDIFGTGHANFDSTFVETVEVFQPADGSDAQETITRHSEYTLDERDTMLLELSGAVSGGWITTSIDGEMGYNRNRDVVAWYDETIAPDGTVTTDDYTWTHTVQGSVGLFEINAGGSFSDGTISVGFGLTYNLLFDDFKDELVIVEDGTITTHEVTQENSFLNVYTHTMSASSPGYSTSSTATGGNSAANTIERNLVMESVEGVTRAWSDYSSTTTTPQGTTTTSGNSSDVTTYEYVRALTYPAAQDGWQTQHYDRRTIHNEHTDYPDGTFFDHNLDLTDTNGFGVDPYGLMHPSIIFGGPLMFPTTGTFGPAWAADQPGAGGSGHFSEGTTPDGGRWEHFDDGYYWWYKRWDAEGALVEDESGYHHMSGGSGFMLARNTAIDGQDDAAPLNGLQGGRADYGVERTGDLDGDGTADHLDRDMDGDGTPNDRDSDENGNGIRDWMEEVLARRYVRAGRKLFNEFWTGLSDIDRQQWREDYANGKLDMLDDFLLAAVEEEGIGGGYLQIPPEDVDNTNVNAACSCTHGGYTSFYDGALRDVNPIIDPIVLQQLQSGGATILTPEEAASLDTPESLTPYLEVDYQSPQQEVVLIIIVEAAEEGALNLNNQFDKLEGLRLPLTPGSRRDVLLTPEERMAGPRLVESAQFFIADASEEVMKLLASLPPGGGIGVVLGYAAHGE
jgi:hypothetical protein